MSAVDEGFAKIEASPVLALARDRAEIEAALAAGRLAVVPGTQGSSMIDKELARVGILARLGFRFFGLAYTGVTLFADGCGEKRDAGLSFLGEELIAAVNETPMILDLSHTGHRSRPRRCRSPARRSAPIPTPGTRAQRPQHQGRDGARHRPAKGA